MLGWLGKATPRKLCWAGGDPRNPPIRRGNLSPQTPSAPRGGPNFD
jgi:hypothetical protein